MTQKELNAAIKASLDKYIKTDSTLKALNKKVIAGTATQKDILTYADKLGARTSKLLKDANMSEAVKATADLLPESVKTSLKLTHGDINDFAAAVQKGIDKADGVKLKAIPAKYPNERVDALAQKISDMIAKGELAEVETLLGEPIKNISLSFVDDFIKANAEARSMAGMRPKIVRTPDAHACRWCKNLGGTYDYESLGNSSDVYKRHDNCHCLVEFINGEFSQNVHTKAKTMLSTSAVKALEKAATPKKISAEALALLEDLANE